MKEEGNALDLDIRNRIYRVIEKSPGLHFREIQRRTNTAVGSLQYHLEFLGKRHLIRAEREGKFVRYHAVRGKEEEADRKTLGLLRQQSVRRIVLFMLTNKRASNASISRAIGLSPSTTSWHIDKLVSAGLVEKKRRGRKSFFYLTNPNNVAGLLVSYRKSFLDELVDGFAEIWQEI